jgi:hypothetical protein
MVPTQGRLDGEALVGLPRTATDNASVLFLDREPGRSADGGAQRGDVAAGVTHDYRAVGIAAGGQQRAGSVPDV